MLENLIFIGIVIDIIIYIYEWNLLWACQLFGYSEIYVLSNVFG